MDNKGRVAIPAIFRTLIRSNYGGQLIATHGLEGQCLWLFPLEEWVAFEKRIRGSGIGGRALIRLERVLIGSAEACDPDKAGRILLPDHLTTEAGLEKEVMFVGLNKRIVVWRPDLWLAEQERLRAEETLEGLDDVVF